MCGFESTALDPDEPLCRYHATSAPVDDWALGNRVMNDFLMRGHLHPELDTSSTQVDLVAVGIVP